MTKFFTNLKRLFLITTGRTDKLVFSLEEVAKFIGAELRGDAAIQVNGVGTIETAKPGQITFLTNVKYKPYLANTQASAVITSAEHADACPGNVLVVDNPQVAFVKIARLAERKPKVAKGLHYSVVKGKRCRIHRSASIAAHCVLGNGVTIGKNVIIGAGCVLGDNVSIAEGTQLYSNVNIYFKTSIGKHCIIHSGAVIGSDGFGFAPDDGHWLKIPQMGGVQIGNHVEIGACTTIDRGAVNNTIIGDGVKLDNQIQIAHNVQIGDHTAIAACVGIAGSTKIGKHCMIGGSAMIAGHLTIGDKVILTGSSTLNYSIDKAGIYSSGMKVQPSRVWRKNAAQLTHLSELAKRVKELEKQINQAEK